MYKCKYCDKEFETPQGLSGHIGHCTLNPKNQIETKCPFCDITLVNKKQINQHIDHCELNPNKKEYKYSKNPSGSRKINLPEINESCKFCGRSCHNILSLKGHERLCPNNPDRQLSSIEIAFKEGKIKSWNKGLTKYTDPRVAKNSKSLQQYYETHEGSFKGKTHSQKSKDLLSQKITEVFHKDDNRFMRTAHGWYDDQYFMSGWELAYYIFQKDKGYSITRCNERFPYIYQGKEHYYYPDFILNNVQYVEVKGLEHEKDLVKYESVPALIVVRESEILPMIKYVKDKFKISNLQELLIIKEG